MLALRPLFRRETAIKTAMAVLEEPVPRADQGRPWVPRELADVAEKALQRDANDRYATARDLGRDLRNFIARSGVPFESAEVAEWMEYLFDDRYAKRRAVVQEVESLDASTVQQLGANGHPRVPEDRKDSASRQLRLDIEPDSPPVLPTRTRRTLLALLALAVLAGALWVLAGDRIVGGVGGAEAVVAGEGAEEESLPAGEIIDESDPYEGVDMVFEPQETTTEPLADAPPPAPEEVPAVQPTPAKVPPSAAHRSQEDHEREDEPTEQGEVALSGALRVRAPGGWAQVLYQGRDLGRTPVRFDLPPGPHTVQVLPGGEEPGQSIQVRIEAGTLKTITVHIPQ